MANRVGFNEKEKNLAIDHGFLIILLLEAYFQNRFQRNQSTNERTEF